MSLAHLLIDIVLNVIFSLENIFLLPFANLDRAIMGPCVLCAL